MYEHAYSIYCIRHETMVLVSRSMQGAMGIVMGS